MKRQWTRDELADHWTLAPKELELLANKTGATRLGFAVLLKAFVLEGRFPRQKHDVPGVVIVHVANQVNVPADLYPSYEWSGRTIEYHRAQIREFLGFREESAENYGCRHFQVACTWPRSCVEQDGRVQSPRSAKTRLIFGIRGDKTWLRDRKST